MQSLDQTSWVWADIKSLKPNPRNPNKHSPEQIERLAKLLDFYGWRHPIIVSNQSGLIVAGHGRLEAAKKLGREKVPVHFQEFQNEEEELGFLTSDNAIASWAELDLGTINAFVPDLGPDFDLDLLGIKDFTLDASDKFEGDEDAVPETPIEPKVKRGELWILGSHRLLIDDCTVKENAERLMGGETADMVFTSPPYSDLRDYSGGLQLDPAHLAKFLEWPAKTFYVNLGLIIREREIVPYWDAYLSHAKTLGLKLLSWNIWDKGNASAPAHQQAMFGLCHEWIFAFGEYRELNLTNPNKGTESWGKATVREKDGSLTAHSRGEYRTHRQLDTVISMLPQKNYAADYTGHPAAFPVSLPEEYIKAASDTGELVGDPFLGSGSTLIACEKTNRKCFGMEIDPFYGQVILERWAKFTGKDPIREDGVSFASLKSE